MLITKTTRRRASKGSQLDTPHVQIRAVIVAIGLEVLNALAGETFKTLIELTA